MATLKAIGKRFWWIPVTLAVVAVVAVVWSPPGRERSAQTLTIAVIGPLSGEHQADGQDLLRGVELRVRTVNRGKKKVSGTEKRLSYQCTRNRFPTPYLPAMYPKSVPDTLSALTPYLPPLNGNSRSRKRSHSLPRPRNELATNTAFVVRNT